MLILPQENLRAIRSERAAPVMIPAKPETTAITPNATPASRTLKPLNSCTTAGVQAT
jgi:hypothetical protein